MTITRRLFIGGAAAALAQPPAGAQERVTIRVAYAFAGIMRDPLEEIARRFMAEQSGVAIVFDAPVPDYEQLAQRSLLGAVAGDGPDVALHGYHRVRLLAARDAAVAAPADLAPPGVPPAARALCESRGHVYGLPVATSTQIVYYNLDIVARVGGDPANLPRTWPEILALARAIAQVGAGASVFFDYKGAGNWGFLALVQSHGGRMMSEDERSILLDGPAGMAALDLLRAFGEAGQVDMSRAQAQQAFAAGGLGILVFTSSALNAIEQQVAGRFRIGTVPFPIVHPEGRIPAGGTCAMVFSRDAARRRAAWDFILFAGGPVGQTIMASPATCPTTPSRSSGRICSAATTPSIPTT